MQLVHLHYPDEFVKVVNEHFPRNLELDEECVFGFLKICPMLYSMLWFSPDHKEYLPLPSCDRHIKRNGW